MANPFKSYRSFFQDLQGGEPTTGGGLQYEPETGIAIGASQPQTPPSPPTPTFTAFGEEERPASFAASPGPQPQPRPERRLSAAVGGSSRQGLGGGGLRRAAQRSGQTRSSYTSGYQPSAIGGGGTPAGIGGGTPQTGGGLTYEPPVPQTGGPLTYQPPAPPVAARAAVPVTPAATPAAPPPPVAPVLPEPTQLAGYQAPEVTNQYYQQLLSPLTSQLGEGYGALSGATGDFYGQLPDERTWESLGGPALMEAALGPQGPERLQAENQLKEILGAQYTGAAGLDLEAVSDLYGISSELSPYGAGGLSSLAGASSLLEAETPGLTPGMRREEARRMLSDEDYQTFARQLGRDVSRLGGTTEREVGAAQEAARGISESEDLLAQTGRGALEGRRGEISGEISGRVEEAGAARQALDDAYEQFVETGDLSALEAYGITPETFDTERVQLDREAKEVKAGILGDEKYATIADVPLLQYGISGHGREKRDFPQEWYDANKDKYTSSEMANIKKLSRQRQNQLDEAGFARPNLRGQGGKYTGVENIYFGGDAFDPGELDPGLFTRVESGASATRHNLATEDQREDFNFINQMLGESERLHETDPYEAAQIVTEVEEYINALELQYQKALGSTGAAGKQFDAARRRTRKAYRKAKRLSKYVKIGAGVGTVFGLPGEGASVGAGLA